MIDWVHESLISWGAWSRGDMRLTTGGTVIGKMMKRKQIENGDIHYDIVPAESMNDDRMLEIDRALQSLPSKFRYLCKLKYIRSYGVVEIATRMKCHRNTVRNMTDDIHSRLEKILV